MAGSLDLGVGLYDPGLLLVGVEGIWTPRRLLKRALLYVIRRIRIPKDSYCPDKGS
jgi:hypothetical protein